MLMYLLLSRRNLSLRQRLAILCGGLALRLQVRSSMLGILGALSLPTQGIIRMVHGLGISNILASVRMNRLARMGSLRDLHRLGSIDLSLLLLRRILGVRLLLLLVGSTKAPLPRLLAYFMRLILLLMSTRGLLIMAAHCSALLPLERLTRIPVLRSAIMPVILIALLSRLGLRRVSSRILFSSGIRGIRYLGISPLCAGILARARRFLAQRYTTLQVL